MIFYPKHELNHQEQIPELVNQITERVVLESPARIKVCFSKTPTGNLAKLLTNKLEGKLKNISIRVGNETWLFFFHPSHKPQADAVIAELQSEAQGEDFLTIIPVRFQHNTDIHEIQKHYSQLTSQLLPQRIVVMNLEHDAQLAKLAVLMSTQKIPITYICNESCKHQDTFITFKRYINGSNIKILHLPEVGGGKVLWKKVNFQTRAVRAG